jgi:hypothetical protein
VQQVLVNPQTGLAEGVDPTEVQAKIQAGYHLPLHNAEGKRIHAPYEEASQGIASGEYRQPDPQELTQWMTLSHYQQPEQKAIAAIEGAARGAFGPVATYTEVHGLGINPADIEARKTLNPEEAIPAEVGTMGVLTAASLGLFGEARAAMAGATIPGLISKAGKAADEGIRLTGTFGNIAKGMAAGAIESSLYSAQNNITEHILGNPDATAEHILGDIGVSAVLGAGLGGALRSGAGPLAKLSKTAEKIKNAVGEETAFSELSGTLGRAATEQPSLTEKLSEIGPKDLFNILTNPTKVAASKVSSLLQKYGVDSLIEHFPGQAARVGTILGAIKPGLNALSNIEQASAGMFGYGAFSALKEDASQKEFHDLYKSTEYFAQNQPELATLLANQSGSVGEHMPETMMQMSKTIANAVEYLQQNKPQLNKAAPLDMDPKANATQIAHFNDVANVVNNPLSVLNRLKDGTLSSVHIRALSSVYPNVLLKMQEETMKNLIRYQSEKRPPLPYKMRLGLSKLFGHPMDSSLVHVGTNQVTLAGIGMAKAAMLAPQERPSKSGMGRMKIGARDETRAQSALQRKVSP